MDELLVTLARDLPSTAVLILFLCLTNRQFGQLLDILESHLTQIHALLQKCIGDN